MGLAFYTLQMLSYLIDIASGKINAEKNLARYALYISFFPQILQGPIPRWSELAPQLFEGHEIREKNLREGLQLVLWGFFLKWMIADKAAILVNTVFDRFPSYQGVYILIAGILYSLQLYTDFLACTVDELELAFREENREGHTWESATCTEVENAGTWAEVDNLGYGQRVEHMMLVELVDILARNDINLSVPVAIEFAKCGKLLQLYIVKIREISVDNLCVHCNDFKKLGLIIFCIWA